MRINLNKDSNRVNESVQRYLKTTKNQKIIKIKDITGKDFYILQGIEVSYHNLGKENMILSFSDVNIPSYVRLINYIINKFTMKITVMEEKKAVKKYFLSSKLNSFNISNKELCSVLKISSSTLSDDIIKLEKLRILNRFTVQESNMTISNNQVLTIGNNRKMNIDIKRFISYLNNPSGTILSPQVIMKELKRKNNSMFLQLKKVLLFRIFTLLKIGTERGKNFQEFIKFQKDKLKMKVQDFQINKNFKACKDYSIDFLDPKNESKYNFEDEWLNEWYKNLEMIKDE